MYVTATNSVGPGAKSGTTTAEPNAVPDQVAGLVTNPGDKQITLTWQPAGYSGTAPTGYEVKVSPLPAGQPSAILDLGRSLRSTRSPA